MKKQVYEFRMEVMNLILLYYQTTGHIPTLNFADFFPENLSDSSIKKVSSHPQSAFSAPSDVWHTFQAVFLPLFPVSI